MSSDKIPSIHPQTIWRRMEDGVVLVTPEAGRVRVLNEVGSVIWRLIDGRKSLEEIQAELVKKYEVTPEQARNDLHDFMHELTARNLITWENEA